MGLIVLRTDAHDHGAVGAARQHRVERASPFMLARASPLYSSAAGSAASPRLAREAHRAPNSRQRTIRTELCAPIVRSTGVALKREDINDVRGDGAQAQAPIFRVGAVARVTRDREKSGGTRPE